MFNITPKLKQYMIENHAVAKDATDEAVNKAIADALLEGKLDIAKVKELAKADAEDAAAKVKAMVAEEVKAANAPVLEALAKLVNAKGSDGADLGAKLYSEALASTGATIDASGKLDEATRVRVKSPLEQFSDSRTEATWDKSHNPYMAKTFGGLGVASNMEGLPYASIDMPTDRAKAIAGVVFKAKALRALRSAAQPIQPSWEMKQHEKDLLAAVVHECSWVGEVEVGGKEYKNEKLSEMHRKAILDDSISGGLEAVPIEFDAAVILTPLLHGELFPLVTVKNVKRRRIEAAKVGNPTMMWGVGSGTAISLFDTDSFITAFDNNIHVISGAIELGNDFLGDSPLEIGEIVVQNYGEAFKQEMDNVIATGNGTNQPEGLFTAAGVTSLTPASGAGQPPQLGDYESLVFTVPKQYHAQAGYPPNSRAVFIGTQTSYKRARQIPVDSSTDARRLLGLDHMKWNVLDYKFAINSSLTNAKIGFFCMNRYRMYRNGGLEVVWVNQTDFQLVRENKRGLVVRARFGGALEDASAGAKSENAQA